MKKEYVYAGISIFLWSTTATVTKLLLGSLNSMQVMLVSSVVVFVFLMIVNLVKGTFKEIKQYKFLDHLQMFIFISPLFVFGYRKRRYCKNI